MNQELQMHRLAFEEAEEPEIKFPIMEKSIGSWRKKRSPRKTSISLTMLNPLCISQQTVENSWRDGNTRPPYLSPELADIFSTAEPQDWKRSVFIPIPKKSNAKGCSNYCTIAFISHASKVMLKNSPSQALTVHEPRNSRCLSWI